MDLCLCLFWLDPAFVDFQGPNVLILYRYNSDLFSCSAVLLFFLSCPIPGLNSAEGL